MALQKVVVSIFAFGILQSASASASAAQTDAGGLGSVNAILDYCIKVDEKDAVKLQTLRKVVNAGQQMSALSQAAYEKTMADLNKLNKDTSVSICAAGVKGLK